MDRARSDIDARYGIDRQGSLQNQGNLPTSFRPHGPEAYSYDTAQSPMDEEDDVASTTGHLGKKPRRKRTVLSCTACKVRKIKCDRNVPGCASCVRRGIAYKCRWGDERDEIPTSIGFTAAPFASAEGSRSSGQTPQLLARIDELEREVHALRAERARSSHGGTVQYHRQPREASLERSDGRAASEADSSISADEANVLHQLQTEMVEDAAETWAADSVPSSILPPGSTSRDQRGREPSHRQLFPACAPAGYQLEDLEASTEAARDSPRSLLADLDEILQLLPHREFTEALVGEYVKLLDSTFPILHVPTFTRQLQSIWHIRTALRHRMSVLSSKERTPAMMRELDQWGWEWDQQNGVVTLSRADTTEPTAERFDDDSDLAAQPKKIELQLAVIAVLFAVIESIVDSSTPATIAAAIPSLPIPRSWQDPSTGSGTAEVVSGATYSATLVSALLTKYYNTVHRCLRMSNFWTRPCLEGLMALSILRFYYFNRSQHNLYAAQNLTAIRLAQTIGLHALGSAYEDEATWERDSKQGDTAEISTSPANGEGNRTSDVGSATDHSGRGSSSLNNSGGPAPLRDVFVPRSARKQGDRLDSGFADGDRVRRELGRRVWYSLVTMEWFMSSHMGITSAVPLDDPSVTTQLPLEVSDELLETSRDLRALPTDQPVRIGFLKPFTALARISMKVAIGTRKGEGYRFVSSADAEVRELLDSLPRFYVLDGSTEETEEMQRLQSTAPFSTLHRTLINDFANHRILCLHRLYMARGYRDVKFAKSTQYCIQSALACIRARVYMTQKWSAQPPDGWTMRLHLFHAATTLQMDLLHNALQGTAWTSRLDEQQAAVDDAVSILISTTGMGACMLVNRLRAETMARRGFPPGPPVHETAASAAVAGRQAPSGSSAADTSARRLPNPLHRPTTEPYLIPDGGPLVARRQQRRREAGVTSPSRHEIAARSQSNQPQTDAYFDAPNSGGGSQQTEASYGWYEVQREPLDGSALGTRYSAARNLPASNGTTSARGAPANVERTFSRDAQNPEKPSRPARNPDRRHEYEVFEGSSSNNPIRRPTSSTQAFAVQPSPAGGTAPPHLPLHDSTTYQSQLDRYFTDHVQSFEAGASNDGSSNFFAVLDDLVLSSIPPPENDGQTIKDELPTSANRGIRFYGHIPEEHVQFPQPFGHEMR